MSSKKTFLIMLITLILITMGGAWASDDHAMDEISATDDDAIAVDSVDNTQKDTSTIKENLTSQKNDEAVKAADSQSNQKGEILSASNDEDVLGETEIWPEDRTISNTIDNINSGDTIDGNGHSITMAGNNRIYKIDGKNNVVFQNITFIGGQALTAYHNKQDEGGGAVYIGSSSVSFYNCVFKSNSAKFSGGAICALNSDVTLFNCTFDGNYIQESTSRFGGAVYFNTNQNCVNQYNITNCTFINNKNDYGGYGAVYATGPNTENNWALKITIKDCVFIGNSATGNGGGLGLNRVKDSIIENVTFKHNLANNGAAIMLFGILMETIDVKNCKFINNTANQYGSAIKSNQNIYIPLTNCSFESNKALSKGVIYFDNSIININAKNCSFINNRATAGDGGALYVPNITNFEIDKDCKFINNSASGNGGAIYFAANSYKTIENLEFEGNTAASGGAIYFAQGIDGLTITKSNFTNNKATSSNAGAIYIAAGSDNTDINNCKFIGNNATSGNGGSIYFKADSDNITITDSVFDNNTAKSGGAVQFYAASSDIGFTNIDITRTNFTNNNATQSNDYGGSAIAFNKVTDVDFDKCVFDNNVATKYGALMFENYNDIYYNECNFTNNNAGEGGVAYYRGSSSRTTVNYMKCLFENNSATNGGAIYSTGKNLTMTKCTYINNTATGDAGVVYSTGDNLIIKDGDFKNNTADKGGIIYATGNTLNITNSNFTNNAARHYAGVVYATGDYINVLNSKFDDNEARPLVARERSNGGVMYILGNHVTIKKSNFTNNLAWSWGGAIIMGDEDGNKNLIQTDDLKIISCRFVDNQAYNAAAIDTYGTSNAHILHTVFINNQAGQTAGAVYMTGAAGLIDDCNFTNNKAINGSAIMYIPPPVGTVDPTMSNITNCNFIGNNATGNATLWFESSKGRIVSCNFTNNTVKDNSGAIYLNIDQVTIDGNRFINNTARDGHGGAIYVQESSKVHDNIISNSVFTNNTAKGNGGAIYDAGKTDNINYCNFTTNRAGKDGGAIYFNSDSGSIIGSRFINNTAVNGGAVVLAQSTQTIRDSTFIGNNASGKGGAIHALSKSTLRVQDSTFENNTANDGGAIYFEGYAHSDPIHNNGLILWNDTFIKNTAIYNGGAVYYIVNATYPYRDYNLFNHEGDNSTGRVTWEHAGKELIHTSLFKGNLDYYMNVTAKSEGNRAIVITVVVPGRYNRATVKVNITVYDSEGNVVANLNNVNYTGSTIQNADWNQTTNLTTIQIHLTEQKLGNYTAFVGIQDDMHRYKEQSINYTSELTDKGDFTKLQELIDDALAKAAITGERAVVNLNESRYTYSIDLDPLAGQGQINITGPITINGLGTKTTINALNYCRIFDIHADDVIINNVIFMNGNASGNQSNSLDTAHGGAIHWAGSNGLIENSTFSFNNAYDGGAVFVQSGSFDSINNCEFDHNTVVHNGGAVDWNATKGNLTNSRLFDNKAAYGGAVFVGANGASSNIYNVNFTNNNASQRGGAVDWYGNTGIIELSNFNNNNASYGGAVFVGHATDGGKILNSTFNNNYATVKGGAIDWNATGGEVKYSRFTGNHADYGGAVFVGTFSEEGTIYNSTFNNNYATYNGGAIDWNASKGNVNRSYFYNNYVTEGNGGAIFVGVNGSAGHILNSAFEGNKALNGRGGAVDWYASSGDIEYSNFTDNHAEYGGAVFVGHATEGGNITNSRFISNTADVKGGAVDWNATSGSLRNSYFEKNSADYGGALFVGSHSTSGSAFNNTYIANRATVNGGAIDLNTTGGFINGSRFYNNTAANGGAIFVGSNTTSGHIVNATFEGNNATYRGGAVDWYASAGEIYSSNFNNNRAAYGGAVFVGSATTGGNITLSNFTNNIATVNGGAVDWNASNGKVEDSRFEKNSAANGGAIFVGAEANGGHIKNATFTSNNATLGGAVYLNSVSNVDVSNASFTLNTADDAAAIYVARSTGTIKNSTFDQNDAKSHASDIYVGADSDISLYDLEITNTKESASSIYADSNVTINKTTISNWESDKAIVFNNGESKVIDTVLDGENAILINRDATVNLTRVNNTGANDGDYSVSNNGTLYLYSNNFTCVIINHHKIMTKTTTKVLDGGVLEIKIGESALLNASIVDDNNNIIIVPALTFVDNTTFTNTSTDDKKTHFGTYYKPAQGVYVITAENLGLEDNTLETGILKVKDPNTTLTLNVTQEKQGETVTIKAKINFEGMDATGNVTFYINGVKQYVNNFTKDVDGSFIATLTLNNLNPDTYFVTAVYNGDDTHMSGQNDTYFVVDKRDVNITVDVVNIVNGQNATAVINTTANNGTVTILINGREEKVVEVVKGSNNIDLGKLTPGNYTVSVLYAENTYYKAAHNDTTFEVYEYDMDVSISETQYNQTATITVTLPSDADGEVEIYLNGEKLDSVTGPVNGVYTAVTPALTKVGNYTVNVTYKGNSKYYAREVNGTNFTVTADKDYKFNVTITPENPKYGENVTINVTGPAGQNVTVTIDGANQTVTLNENGTAVITINNLTAGPHSITANITGNENYTSKEITQTLVIVPAVPEMTINVTQPIAPNSPANVTVTVGKNATGTVYIKINNVVTPVEVKDGVAVLPIDTSKPGEYTVTAQFVSDDDNYKSAKNLTGTTYTVDKYNTTVNSTVEIGKDNHVTVTVKVNGTADGNVTLYLNNGTNITVDVENGVATFDLGIITQKDDYNFTAVFNGDDTFNTNMTTGDFTVGKLNNGTMNITVVPNPAEFGDGVEVIIDAPGLSVVNLTVTVNGVDYNATRQADGKYVAVIPDLPVNVYDVNVTCRDDPNYNDFNASTTYEVKANSSYEFRVEVTPAPFGGNTTINITGPAGENVTVTIDGAEQEVTLDENGTYVITLNNLTAGSHNITANITGNENYTSKEINQTFNVPTATPEMNITITQPIAPNAPANITVTVGDNATGTVVIYIDGNPNVVEVKNGTAVLPIDTSKPGTYNVTAQYFPGENDNYGSAQNMTGTKYTVDRYNTTVNSTVEIGKDNHVNVTVKVNGTADGNVTLYLNNGTNMTVDVTDGVAVFDLGIITQRGDYNFTAVFNGDDTFNSNSTKGDFNVGKLNNGTMNITVVPNPAEFGDGVKVIVDAPGLTVENLTVTVNGVDYNATRQADSKYIAVIPSLPVNIYDVNVTCKDDPNYNDFNASTTYEVKTNSSYAFDVDVTQPVKYGENTTITVTGPAGENVTVYVDGVPYTITLNETGEGTKVLNNLSAGPHSVVANITGNDNYTSKQISKQFTVDKQAPSMEIIVPESPIAANATADIVVKVGGNATGNVTIYIDNVRYEAPIVDGEAVLPIDTTKAGTFTVTAQYIGDDNYTGGVNNTAQTYTVNKFDINMTYTNVTVADDNTVTFEVKLNMTDAKGNVTINYNNINYTADVIDGVAKVSVPLTQSTDEYKLTAVYSGDDKYNTTSVNVNVTVGKLGNGTMAIDITPKPVQYGDNATVTVSIPDVSDGNVTVWIDGENYTAVRQADGIYVAVLPALPVGNHPINVTYANGTRYKNFHNDTVTLSVETNSSYEFDVDVAPGKYGENTTITVNAPAGVKQVNVTVDNETYTVNINATTGKGTLVLNNLSAGNHKVTANFTGNNNYTAKTVTEQFTVAQQTPSMEIIVPQSPIAANTTANIVVKVGKNATGNVTIYIDNVRYEAPIVDGEAVLAINTTKAGTFSVTAQYIGDANYTGGANNTVQKYTVNKFDISMTYENNATVALDNTVTFEVKLNQTDAKGFVTITIDGKDYDGEVTEGVAKVTVGPLDQSTEEYQFTAVYSGDDKYNTTSVEVNVTVGKLRNGTMTVEIIPNPSEYGDSINVTVTIPDVSDGNVTVWIDGENHTAVRQDDGTYVAVIPSLSVGDHPVNVTYTDGSRYDDFYNDDMTIITTADGSYFFNVEVDPAKYGDNTTITVTAPAGVGKVNVTVDNVTYSVEINATTGKGTLVLNNISAGLHNVTASFAGNKNYTEQELTRTFTVPRQDPEMQIIVPAGDITVNTKENVTLIIGNNATGDAIIYIDNVPYPVTVENGIATVPIDTTKPGVHNVTAKYFGDENYAGGSNNTVISYTVGKFNTTMNVEYKVNDDNSVTFTVKVNDTAGGNITVEVGGKPYNATVTNGLATLTTDPLDNGTYTVTVNYNGDDRFNTNASDVDFEIKGLRNFTVKIEVIPGKHNETTKIIVTGLPENADGNVTVNINGKDYPATLYANGTAVRDVVLPAGDYDVNVTYNNSDKYEAKENSTSFKVDKQDTYPLDIKVTPAPFGENSTITITAPADVKEVNVTVDGETHTVPIDENGKGILKLDNLTAGKHDVTVTYNGDANYTESTNSTSFNVPKQTPEMNVDISPNRQPNTNITVTVKVGDNATGLVNVVVDGKDNIVPVRADGTVEFNTTALAPGNHTIEVKLLSDDNYNATSVGPYTITMDKYNTTMDCTKETTADNNVTIVVKLNNTVSGTVYVEYDGTNYSADVENGVARVNLGIISEQKDYILPVYYSGDENFNKNSTEVKFKVDKLENATVKVDITPGEYGDNTTIKVTVPSDGDGNVTIYIDSVPTVVTPVDGVAVLNVTPGVGPHDVRVEYTNDTRYAPKQNTTAFTVPKDSNYDFTVDIVPKDANYTDEVTVIVKAPAGLNEVNVTIDGVTVTVPIDENGTGTYKISNLTSGDHTVIAGFEGNENYTKSSTSASFTIGKTAPTMTVNVTQDPVEAGSDVQITVSIDKNATGQVNIIVDGADHLVDITDGVATYTVKGVTPNVHNITVKYNGDVNYTAGEKNASFTVKDYPTTVTLEGIETDENNNVTVIVKVNGTATGNVTVTIGDKTYTANVTDGVARVNVDVLPKGDQEINITYNGDDDYAPQTITETITVPALKNYTLGVESKDIKYGETAQVNVTLPEGASPVNLTFILDGNVITEGITQVPGTNIVQVNIPDLKAGDHTVTVRYAEDNTYADNENSTTFNVATVQPGIKNITVHEPIGVGETLNITVELPEDATGTITVDVNGTKYVADVVNGTANITIPKLDNGTYNITVTYSGDDNYDGFTERYNASVEKVNPEITANTTEIKLGEDAVINVTLPSDATGTVTVKVGDIEKTFAVTGGENSLSIPGIPVGENQEVTVTYNGDNKYAADNTTVLITVKPKDTTADDFNVEDMGNGTIIVTAPEGATGEVNLTIGNETYTVNITDGKAVFNIANDTNQTPGVHEIKVSYAGDENNTAVEFNSTANVPKWESEVTVDVPTIRQGDTAKVNVTVTSADSRGYTPNGTVRVYVDGKGYSAELVDGNAVIDVPGLSEGSHDIKVYYDGDDFYLPGESEGEVNVQKPITAHVEGTGNASQVVVELPENDTDKFNVTVKIDDEEREYTIDENGTVKANLTGIKPGEHTLTVIYEDENGTVSVLNKTIIVPPWDSEVSASAKTIREGDVANIVIKVGAEEMTGEVKVDINGTGYYAPIINGEVTIKAPGIKAGTYVGNVTYGGNEKYLASNNTFTLVVEEPIVIDINGTGNSSQVVIDLPANGTNNVTVTIDGNPVDVDFNNRTAVANLTGLEPGDHNITVVYTDADGTQSVVTQQITVPRWSSAVNATAATIREGDDAVIKVKVDSNETGTVYVDIAGTGYYGTLENGEVTIIAPGIKKGKYTGNVTYLGDEKYDPSNNTFTLEVQSEITIELEGAGNSSKVVVQLPEDSEGSNVTVMVDGKEVPVTVDENGTATADLGGLPVGEHNVTVIYKDKNNNTSIASKTVKVYKSINVADEIKRGWNSPYDAEAEFLDKEGHVLANTTVEFTVNGQTYKVVTDEKGIGKLTDSHLAVGKYEATIKNPVTGETVARNVTIVKRIIENKDLTTDYLAGKYYSVKVIGDDGEPVDANEVVGLSVNGVGYVIKSDKNGVAKLKINLVPKKYTIIAEYAKYKVTNKVVVKQTLKLVKKTVKVKKGKKIVIKAKLKWTNGKAIKGKKVTIKFKGKKYSAKTNSKGIAKITIKKKSVLKKLKKGKTYKFTAFYVKEKAKGKIKIK